MISEHNREKGSASIEAAGSLVIFIFLFICIYMIIAYTFVQERIGASLDSAANQISEYAYFYHLFGMEEVNKQLSSSSSDIIGLYDELTSKGEGNVVVGGVEINTDNIESVGEQFMENPKKYLLSLASLAAQQASDSLKSQLAVACAKGIVMNNIAGSKAATEAWLQKNGVSNMDFSQSKMLQSADLRDIDLIVTYEMDISRIIPFAGKLKCAARARTYAWLWGDDSWSAAPASQEGGH